MKTRKLNLRDLTKTEFPPTLHVTWGLLRAMCYIILISGPQVAEQPLAGRLPVAFMRKRKSGEVHATLNASVQKWHISLPLAFYWPKKVMDTAEFIGAVNYYTIMWPKEKREPTIVNHLNDNYSIFGIKFLFYLTWLHLLYYNIQKLSHILKN